MAKNMLLCVHNDLEMRCRENLGDDAASNSSACISGFKALLVSSKTKIILAGMDHDSAAENVVLLVGFHGDEFVHDKDLGRVSGRERHDVAQVSHVAIQRGRVSVSFLRKIK